MEAPLGSGWRGWRTVEGGLFEPRKRHTNKRQKKKKKRGRVTVSLVHTSRLSIGLSTSEICVCLFILFGSEGVQVITSRQN